MLTEPIGVLQSFSDLGTTMYQPIPEGNWYLIATKAQAQQVFDLAKKTFPNIKDLALVNGTRQYMFLRMPARNPKGYQVWLITGTLNRAAGVQLTLDDFLGFVWDRGPLPTFGGSPDEIDSNGSHGGLGGPELDIYDDGSGVAQLRWQQKVEPEAEAA